ncbi:MAG: bacteriohemerythrin [Desulfobulbus sp.]|nr:bacteriohemerythrin [Desulfobulbus sp.]
MLTIAWDDRYLIGIPIIDNQHKYLLQLLNTLYEDYAACPATDYLEELFNNLIAYTSYHFALEERWMECHHYPRLDEHRVEHAAFSVRVAQMQQQYAQQRQNVSLEAIHFLYNWLSPHIQGSDYDFGCFIGQQEKQFPTRLHDEAEATCLPYQGLHGAPLNTLPDQGKHCTISDSAQNVISKEIRRFFTA